MSLKNIELEYGLNRVVYKDTRTPIPEDKMLYYNDKPIGTLKQVKAHSKNLQVYDATPLGDATTLKNSLKIDDGNSNVNGGNRKSRGNRKSKKLINKRRKSNSRR